MVLVTPGVTTEGEGLKLYQSVEICYQCLGAVARLSIGKPRARWRALTRALRQNLLKALATP
jgi:hypothetical protein